MHWGQIFISCVDCASKGVIAKNEGKVRSLFWEGNNVSKNESPWELFVAKLNDTEVKINNPWTLTGNPPSGKVYNCPYYNRNQIIFREKEFKKAKESILVSKPELEHPFPNITGIPRYGRSGQNDPGYFPRS